MSYPNDRRYSKSHEWAKPEDGRVVVGITQYAQDSLGDIVHLGLPALGDQVVAGKGCAEIESVKSAADIYSPVSGKVVRVNEALNDSPELVNQSPHEDAWMFEVEMEDGASLDGLFDAAAYAAYLKGLDH